MTYKEGKKDREKPQWDVKLISCFTIPLCLPLYWAPNLLATKFEEGGKWIKLQKNWEIIKAIIYNFWNVLEGFFIGICVLVSVICYLILVVYCLLKFLIIDLAVLFIWPHHDVKRIIRGVLLRLPVFVISIFLTGMIFISVLSLVASSTLNAEYFIPFIAPVITVTAYFWKNWRWSVEAQCVQLKTLIIEVSRKKVEDETDTNANTKNNKKSTSKLDHFCAFLCPCLPDTSEEIPKDSRNSPSTGEKGQEMEERPSREPSNTDSDKPVISRGKRGRESYRRVATTAEPNPDTSGDSTPSSSNGDKNHRRVVAEREGSLRDQTDTENKNSPRPSTSNGDTDKKENIIKFDKHGEAEIFKELYKSISENVLPLDFGFIFFEELLLSFCMPFVC